MNEEKKQKIIEIVKNEKMPLKDLAKRLYISEYQLKLLLKSWGIELPKKRKYRRVPIPKRERLMELYSELGNTEKVAKNLGVGINTVNRWMKALNIPTKKLGKMTEYEKTRFIEKHLEMLKDIDL